MLMRLICFVTFVVCSVFADEGTFTRLVKADSVYLKVIGSFDPKLHDLFFISSLQTRFDDFCQEQVANLIYGFDLAVMFMNKKTQYNYNGQDGKIAITSWCEIQTTFSLPQDSDPILFSSNNASRMVMNFCTSNEMDKLKDELDDVDNVTVITIASFFAESKEVQQLLKDQSTPYSDLSSSSSEAKSLVTLAYVSLAIILLGTTALVLSSLRRKFFIAKIEHEDSSDILRVPSADNTFIKQAICHDVSNENESLGSASNQTDHNDLESLMVSSNCETSESERASEIGKEESAVGGDPSGRKFLCTSETFDDDESASSRIDVYREYQSNSSLPSNSISPAWSMDSFSQNTSPYSSLVEGLSKRRRWHDEANDLNLLSLPESFSTSSSTYHSSTSSNGTNKS